MKRLQLVEKDARRGYHVPLETLMQLKGLPQTLKVSCVVMGGKAKSGRSYLLNRLFLESSKIKFQVNPSVEQGTFGLQIILLRDGDNLLVLIDCEGVDCPNGESQKQLLALQLASYYIFNSLGPLDEKSLELLSFLLRMADWQGLEPPEFVWVLRDFSLSLRDSEGRGMTEDEYLERTLRTSETAEDRNTLRKAFKRLFPYRSLLSMPRPVTDEKQLQSIQSLSNRQLRSQFQDKLNLLRANIGNNLKPKRSNGTVLTLADFIRLAEGQCKVLNERGTDFHSSSFFVEKNGTADLLREIAEEALKLESTLKAKQWAVKQFRRRNVYGGTNEGQQQLLVLIENRFQQKVKEEEQRSKVVESRLVPESRRSDNQTSIRLMMQPKLETAVVEEEAPRFSKFSSISSIPEKKPHTGTDLLAKIITEMEEEHELQLRNCKRSMEQCIKKSGTSTELTKQEQLLRLEIAYLESQNSFLRVQNRQKQTIISSLLAMPIPTNDESRYTELLTVNRKLSEALKNAQQKLQEAEQKKYKSRRKANRNEQDNHQNRFTSPPTFSITDTVVRHDTNGKPFIEYEIHVHTREKDLVVRRKYKTFIEMHGILEDLFPGFRSESPFSLKQAMHMIGSRGTSIAERCKDLEHYLNSLAKVPEVLQCEVFRGFIGLQEMNGYGLQNGQVFQPSPPKTSRMNRMDYIVESPRQGSSTKLSRECPTSRSSKHNNLSKHHKQYRSTKQL